ncbi:MAG: DUF533 domain-containing protein [Pseudomonadota bacterium]
MTRFLPIVIAALLLLLPASQADAGKMGLPRVRTAETLHLVSSGDIMSVCHLVKRRTVAFLGVSIESKGYVLSDNRCEGESYFSLAQPIEQLIADGYVPAATPTEPTFSPRELLEGYSLWPLLALLVLGIGAAAMMRKKRRDIRMQILSLEDGPVFRMIDMMCHAAIADGRIDPAEVDFIRGLARELTGLDYQDAHITEAIERADKFTKPADFKDVARGLNHRQRHMILDAALSVVAADGEMSKKEKVFIGAMTTAFGLTTEDVEHTLNRFVIRRGGGAPA